MESFEMTKAAILTAEEERFYYKNGYLVVEDALTKEEVDIFHQAIVKIRTGRESSPLNYANIFNEDKTFLELIDLPTVFPKIWGLLGENIWVNHSHYVIVPPEQKQKKIYYGWHRDGGMMRQDVGQQLPPLFTKAAFYLNDLTKPVSGQTYVIPGSHHFDSVQIELDQFSIPDSAVPLNVKAGTVVIYHPNLIHSVHSPNYSEHAREAVFIQWAYRWLFPASFINYEKLGAEVTDPIRRQLLGFTTIENHMRDNDRLPYASQNRSGRYKPLESELPLRQYIENLGEKVKGRVCNP